MTALRTISPRLTKELEEYRSFRTATLNRLRTGTKVVDVTFDHEKQVHSQRSWSSRDASSAIVVHATDPLTLSGLV